MWRLGAWWRRSHPNQPGADSSPAPVTDTGLVHQGFPTERFVEGVRQSREMIRVLAIHPYVMREPHRDDFLDALGQALRRAVDVRMLLLDPQSRATEQYAEDLGHAVDVATRTAESLRDLRGFRASLEPSRRRHLDVRVYSALPPARTYRWDDTAVTTLAPGGDWTGSDVEHVQTPARSGLGRLADRQFDSLWNDHGTRTLDAYFTAELDLLGPTLVRSAAQEGAEVDTRQLSAAYIQLDQRVYVAERSQPAHLWRPDGDGPLVRILAGPALARRSPVPLFHAVRVDPGHPAMAGLVRAFRRKYGSDSPVTGRGSVVVRLDTVAATADRRSRTTGGETRRRLSRLSGVRRPPERPERLGGPPVAIRAVT